MGANKALEPALGIGRMHLFEETARPVIFEHENAEFPYWGKGSSILVASPKRYFWITALHVITNMGGSARSLR